MKKILISNVQFLTSASTLPLALLVANFASFLFNAVLGRNLSFTAFGTITVLNSFWYLLSIPINALNGTIIQRTAFLTSRESESSANSFYKYFSSIVSIPTVAVSLIWILATPFLMSFFHIDSALPIILFSPAIYFGTFSLVHRGYLQGKLLFLSVAITILIENISRLLFALLLVYSPLSEYTYLSIPLSILCAYVAALVYIKKLPNIVAVQKKYTFPRKFFMACMLSGIATTTFITIDVILVQHFFDSTTAGQYALLSLIGKMIYFFGTILNGVLFTHVSNHEGAKRNSTPLFYKVLLLSTIATFGFFVLLGPFGSTITPILFGDKINSIAPYLTPYAFALSLFTISTIVSGYHITREKYHFVTIGIISTMLLTLGITLFHQSLLQVIYIILTVCVITLAFNILIHTFDTYIKR